MATKKLYFIVFFSCLLVTSTAQINRVAIAYDSIKILNAELAIKDSTRNFQGYLFSKNDGFTEFSKFEVGKKKQPIVIEPDHTPQAGDTFLTHVAMINKHIKIWRNDVLQFQSIKKGMLVDSLKGRIAFYPPLKEGDKIYVESTENSDTKLNNHITYNKNANKLNCVIFAEGDTFTLQWTSYNSTLPASHRIIGLGSSSLAGYELLSPDRFGNKIATWFASHKSSPSSVNLVIKSYHTGKILPLSDVTGMAYQIDSALAGSPDFIVASIAPHNLSKNNSVEMTLASFRRIDSIAMSKDVQVFWKIGQPTVTNSPRQHLQYNQIADSVRKIWPDRFLEGYINMADNLKYVTSPVSTKYNKSNEVKVTSDGNQSSERSLFNQWQPYFQPLTGIFRYVIECSTDSLLWTSFDVIRDSSVVKKSYTRTDSLARYFRVKAEYINDQVPSYSNSVKLNINKDDFDSETVSSVDSSKESVKGITLVVSCLLTAKNYSTFYNDKTKAATNSNVYETDTSKNRIIQMGDTIYVFSNYCKQYLDTVTLLNQKPAVSFSDGSSHVPFLQMHGSVQYDFTYRSLVDTPFSQQNFAQHTLQTSVDFVVKDSYPVHMNLLTKKSNSPYFSNITDVNVQFNSNSFLNKIKEHMRSQLNGIGGQEKVTKSELLVKDKLKEVQNLQGWLNNPARIQEIINEKEQSAQLLRNIPQVNSYDTQPYKTKATVVGDAEIKKRKDSLLNVVDTIEKDKKDSVLNNLDSLAKQKVSGDSSSTKILTQYQQKLEQLKKSSKELKEYEQQAKTIKKALQDSLNHMKQEIGNINDPSSLKAYVKKHEIKDLPKGWQELMSINSVGIGRTWLDYSELTVKNISLTGINIETSPKPFYLAFAAGKIDYRFRDFIMKNNDAPKQSIWLARAGIGSKDGNNLVFTYYDGKRTMLNSFNNAAESAPLERVAGISLENRLALDRNNYIILEIAKSSFQNTGTVSTGNEQTMKKVLNMGDHSNEAYSIKFNSYLPVTLTKITGFYRKMGEHFQSFNLQPLNVNQEAYEAKVQQPFWKQQLKLEAGIRKNDFDNPLINPGVSSKTIFKSFQASLRIPKYPFVSVGFYPSSQLSIIDNNVLVQNQYNTLSSVISYSYKVKQSNMTTNAVYLRFYNNSNDTGFLYYNATSLSVNQNINWRSLQLQSGCTYIHQPQLSVVTLEQSVGFQFREWLTMSGGIKRNRVNQAQTLWGNSATVGFKLKKSGTIQLLYDRSYLPGNNRSMVPLDMGRVNYYRSF